jgi:hypothetical protein
LVICPFICSYILDSNYDWSNLHLVWI